eukprot:7235682-Pyramimonas_sp.AAC.1
MILRGRGFPAEDGGGRGERTEEADEGGGRRRENDCGAQVGSSSAAAGLATSPNPSHNMSLLKRHSCPRQLPQPP